MKVIAGDFPPGAAASIHFGVLAISTGAFKSETYTKDKVLAVELVTQSNSSSIMAKAGWGIAGAALLGPIGALAGILGGGNRSNATAAVEFADGKKALISGKAKHVEKLIALGFK